MQIISSGTAPMYHQITDFDFGQARCQTANLKRKAQRPGLVAGLVAFAFTVSMLIPVGAKAEPGPTLFATPYSAPETPAAKPGLTLVEGRHWGPKDWDHTYRDKPRRAPLPAVCALQIDGHRSGFSGYSENCLRDRGLREKLPRGCALNARLFGQRDRLFPADCLRDAGFVLRER